MPVSAAHNRATNKYKKKAYDRFQLLLPKGQKDVIQAHVSERDGSINKFINRAITAQIDRDNESEGSQ